MLGNYHVLIYNSGHYRCQGLPGSLCIFEVFIVSRDTQSNLGFFRTKPLFPDVEFDEHGNSGKGYRD